jgi:hypothetical protein
MKLRYWCSVLAPLFVLSGCVLPPDLSFTYGPWSSPEDLGSVVNTSSNDQHPGISPDGLSLYFHSNRPGNVDGSTAGTSDIWITHRASTASAWGAPQNLGPIVNSTTNDTAPTLSPDGHYLYFGSDRPGGCGLRDIWVSHRSDTSVDTGTGGWETPVNMGCTINSAQNDDGPTYFVDPVTKKVTLYWCSMNRDGGLGDWDIWTSDQQHDGSWSTPVNVAVFNSSGRDTRTSIRYDGLEMYVTSTRAGSVPDANKAPTNDIWVSTRTKREDPWGNLVNVSAINTGYTDGAPSLSADGTELYFFSNRPGGNGANDLYVSYRTRTPVIPPGLSH